MNGYRLLFAAVAACVCSQASAQSPMPLPEIRGVDNSEAYINAMRQGMEARQAEIEARQREHEYTVQQQARIMRQDVGDALARGDFDEAAKIAARGGDIDLYMRIKQLAKH